MRPCSSVAAGSRQLLGWPLALLVDQQTLPPASAGVPRFTCQFHACQCCCGGRKPCSVVLDEGCFFCLAGLTEQITLPRPSCILLVHMQVLLQQVRELQRQLQEAQEQQSTHEAESQVCKAASRFAVLLCLLIHALGASSMHLSQRCCIPPGCKAAPQKRLPVEQRLLPSSAGGLACRCNSSCQEARLLHPAIPPSLSASA